MTASTSIFWHVTVLSNFIRGYDKYSKKYSKATIPESSFPNQFFLLQENELKIGIDKAQSLLRKLKIPGDRLLAIRTDIPFELTKENTRTGLGRFIESCAIRVEGVAFIQNHSPGPMLCLEEVSALSLQLLFPNLQDYRDLKPRTFSVLPIARGCQASCPFCFSEASVSAEQEQDQIEISQIQTLAEAAREKGATRFVITGGGEPGLVKHDKLLEIITAGEKSLGKTILITNGHHIAIKEPVLKAKMLTDYFKAGLSVLAISRHHYDDTISGDLMKLETDVASIIQTWSLGKRNWPGLLIRLICVLQKGGVDSMEKLTAYVDWAVSLGVSELCFKELYVSTSTESVYHRRSANEWSYANQISLSLVLDFAEQNGLVESSRLPWGSPVFEGLWKGRELKIAAYTEPSLFWERAHGIARSWNLMADGLCLASLEDRASMISA